MLSCGSAMLSSRCVLTAAAYGRVATRGQLISVREFGPRQSEQEKTSEPAATTTSRVFRLNTRTQEKEEYPLAEALRALRAYSLSETPETAELSIKVDMMLKKDKMRDTFRGTLIYPHQFGRHRKILLLAEDISVSEVVTSGADIIGGPDHIKKLEEGTLTLDAFDVCICTTGIYNKVKPLHRTLRAKMPTPRRGTVVDPPGIHETVLEYQQSRQYQCDKRGYINMPIGPLNFSDEDILTNMKHLLEKITSYRGNLPTASFIQRMILSSTYGPAFHLITKDYL